MLSGNFPRLDLDLHPIQLIPLVQQVDAEQQEAAKQHQIVVLVPAEDVVVLGDRVHLDRVLTNLLLNAIKYSPEGGSITMEILPEEVEGVSHG